MRWRSRLLITLVLSMLLTLAASSFTYASGGFTQLSSDPYTNPTSQHKTEVEPDNFSYGSTIVNAFQVGRFTDGGSSNTGWATSTDNGMTWKNGFLPGTTVYSTPKGKFARISDPAVAYDAKHKTWMISGLALDSNVNGAAVTISRSLNGGTVWKKPAIVANNGGNGFFDKDWVVCDNTSSSPYYGHCYVEWDLASSGDLVQMSTSSNGGKTWSAAQATVDNASGLGGQPLVQPNGTVVVPYWGNNIQAFVSTNGGTSWSKSVTIGSTNYHGDGGNLRAEPLPSAEIDASGKVYVAWANCQFESGCSANDIVLSTSSDGVHWSATKRVPLDAVGSGVDHFTPGIGVDKTTSGKSAHIGLTYYYYPVSNCSVSTCQLYAAYVSSTNGGSTWSSSLQLAGPMKVTWLANTTGGYMFGDYISTTITNGKAFPVFIVATAPSGSVFNEAAYSVSGGLAVVSGNNSSAGDHSYSVSTRPFSHVSLTAY